MRCTLDIETSGLLDDSTIDYTTSPYKLKPNYKLWCIVCWDIDTNTPYRFVLEECYTKFPEFAKNIETVIVHNGIDFDLLALKLILGMDYTVEPDTWCGRKVEIIDTLVLSKCLNPDRFGGHSLDEWGKRVGYNKIDWREEAISLGLIERNSPRGAEFLQFHPNMVDYCQRDVEVTAKTYIELLKEIGDWPWEDAISLEKAVAEIVTRQKHRGFWFDKDKAELAVKDLDLKMEDIRNRVEPILPVKPMPKTKQKEYTPPKTQFLKAGGLNTHMLNFITKHGGTIIDNFTILLYGKQYSLPMENEPLFATLPATLKDTTHIKEWLVSLGWQPTQYKEKDLTCDTKKKKLTQEKFEAAALRYVEQTLNSSFCKDRCDFLKTTRTKLKDKLLKHDLTKPLKVLTNPTFTVGQEKEIDPMLDKMKDTFPYTQDIVDFLTYQHRRNSILGGGFDPEEDDEEDFEKGFLANMRADHRIPTPADTCGCATSRFKHRICANIPRVTSLYGEVMRSLFGVEKDMIQIGYDFDSLEARIEAHYCFKYDAEDKAYCNSLVREKPFDVHTLTAEKITQIINKVFSRSNAKSVKYGSSYGAQAAKVAKIVGCDLETAQQIFDAFREAAKPLAMLKDALTKYWETTGKKQFVLGIDKRRVPTRSKHALVNSLFQSAGVICAKRAMVIHDRKLRSAGELVDFFKDDFKNLKFTQQLIAYHDESQLETSRSNVKMKTFKVVKQENETKEEAEKRTKKEILLWKEAQEKTTGRVYSDIGHMDGLFYCGYTRAGELAVESVLEAGRYYKLNIDLTAGYMMGSDWASTH